MDREMIQGQRSHQVKLGGEWLQRRLGMEEGTCPRGETSSTHQDPLTGHWVQLPPIVLSAPRGAPHLGQVEAAASVPGLLLVHPGARWP